ncbi:branched-chain amino acid ABC transporter permease [Rhodococcus pseudokoreensis]|uniref:Branched-chain amino acid ABC transporter permease n=1 Tax=Rhodococcus pseudokoreensis TaxID=2811421 RepID=A0A974WBK0_9NOCA|nr:branched-chain amino acid ABC transporter permease [Rhodococcus pseudokoreensis]QSE94844.1 branched-chain amino acid ABC transporter permease [Rhodococcus pseudokoreensis]
MRIVELLRRPRAELDPPRWLARATVAVVILVTAVAPLVSAPYVNFDRSMVLVYVVVGLGLNLLTGNTGQISLGHGFFFAVGAYLSAVLVENHDVPYLLLLPVAFAVCFVIGYLFGLPALRLHGLQLALATLGLALVTPAVIKRFEHVTDGQAGINIAGAEPPAFSGLERDQWVYYLCLVVALIAFFVVRRLSTGRIGRSLIAIRDYEAVATTLGVGATRTKTTVFALSAAFAGVGGVLYSFVVQYVGPEAFGLPLAIAFITMIVIGGLGTVPGVVFGAFFVQYVPQWTAEINQSAAGITYGAALIVFIFVIPYGLISVIRWVLAPLVNKIPGTRRHRAFASSADEDPREPVVSH